MRLSDSIEHTFRLLHSQKTALKKLGLETVEDLLYHFPTHYGERHEYVAIKNVSHGQKVVLYGTIATIGTGKTFRGRRPIARATIADDTGTLSLIWFSQPYIAKMFSEGDMVRIEGTISKKKVHDNYSITNPLIEKTSTAPHTIADSLFVDGEHALQPTYPESRGITSNWLYHAIQKILKTGILETITDPLPDYILKKYTLPHLKTAMIWIHSPKKEPDALAARKRFAFEEILYIQLQKQKQRAEIDDTKSYVIHTDEQEVQEFTNRYPFPLTEAQQRAIHTILTDMRSGHPMSRLLEGDVGSGKTAVAAAAVYSVTACAPDNHVHGALQTAYMVPTEILAKQHFENFIRYFTGSGIQIGLITGSGCYKFPSKVHKHEATKISRAQLLKWIASGEIPIIVGTHALIQKSVIFKHLGLVIIDEQHRFGTAQRKKLAQKEGFTPHLLSMTATPIPRTLALTMYGDLDITLLDQMPAGRKQVITDIVLPNERETVYKKIRQEIAAGRQAYIICPRIDEPDEKKIGALYAKSVKAEAQRLQKEVFPDLTIAEIHSKMRPVEKESVMRRFEQKEIDILVSTSVIEVGVNIPNATMIIIEGAERFGLAQLHQLRGRVIRSTHQSYCFVFTDSTSENSIKRLRAIKTAKNGFELAEMDLTIRGSGELTGAKQWGVSDVGMEALRNIKMVEAAQHEAKTIIVDDPHLDQYPLLAAAIDAREKIHFE